MSAMDLSTLLQAVETANSSERMVQAVSALANSRTNEAIPKLIEVLGYNNPAAAVVAMRGLVNLGEPTVMPLLNSVDEFNYGARAWTVQALAAIADPRALDFLINALQTDFAFSVRRAAAIGLGRLQWPSLLMGVETARAKALQALLGASQDGEWIVRYAVAAALEAIGIAIDSHHIASHHEDLPETRQILFALCQMMADEDVAVRGRALLAHHNLRSLPALAHIAENERVWQDG